MLSFLARIFDWLLQPYARIVARRITDALDSAVLETEVGATSSTIVNALAAKRKRLLQDARDKRNAADKEQNAVITKRDNLVRGLDGWVARTIAASDEVRQNASYIEQDAAELARLQQTLRNGQ